MKKLLIILLTALAALTGTACNKDKNKLPDGTDKVSEYSTIPSFQSVFLAFDKLDPGDLSALKPVSYTIANRDTVRTAFAWGALVAEAQLAVASKNSVWLGSVFRQLEPLAPALGQKDLVVQLEQNVKPLLAAGDWEQIKRLFYELKNSMDIDLMDQKRYGEYTLAALGSWTETANQIGRLIANNYSTEKSRVLVSPAWQNLADNLLLMDSANIDNAFERVQELRDMMNTAGSNALTLEQVEAIVTATDSLRTGLRTP